MVQRISTLVFSLLVLQWACTFDSLPEPAPPTACEIIRPTYENEIQPIIEKYCAYSGCHISGFPNGDYSTYEKMLPRLEDGEIKKRTIIQKDMPDNTAPPGLQKIPAEELQLIECWLANGYPKN